MLSNVWDGKQLRWLDYRNTTSINDVNEENEGEDNILFHPFNGKQWYISINLKAITYNQVSEGDSNDVILKITLPYFLNNDTNNHNNNVKFSRIPILSDAGNREIRGSIDTVNDLRGIYRELEDVPDTSTREFIIRRGMLKNNSGEHTITLSAFAKFTGKINDTTKQLIDNPRLKNDNWENPYGISTDSMVTNLDVEVQYYGKVDLAINWIRLETPRAREIFFGQHDSEVLDAVEIEIRPHHCCMCGGSINHTKKNQHWNY